MWEESKMSIFETIRELRSFQSAKEETLPRKDLGRILEAGRQAPSPGNVQTVEFIVVEDEGMKEVLADATGDDRFVEAPTSVIVLSDIDRMARKVGQDAAVDAGVAEAATAIQNMRLTAKEQGISSTWVTGFDQSRISNNFDIPAEKRSIAIVALCYASREHDKPDKFGLNSIVFYNVYDNQIRSEFDQLEWKGVRNMERSPNRKSKSALEKIRTTLQKYL